MVPSCEKCPENANTRTNTHTRSRSSASCRRSGYRAELEDAYGGEGMAMLQCDGHTTKYLNQVLLCLEVDAETHMPGEQVCVLLVVVEVILHDAVGSV